MGLGAVDLGNVGDLAKPIDSLVNRVSEAIGGIAKPWQIRRVAKAEADAAVIKAEGKLKESDIADRALARMEIEAIRNQDSIEDITRKALPHLKPDANPQNIELDWISYFFEHCKTVTDDVMREHWARLLAQEANMPGSISRRAVNVLSQLDKPDAELFALLRKNMIVVDGQLELLAYSDGQNSHTYMGIGFGQMNHLNSIGLITFDGIQTFGLGELDFNTEVSYFDLKFTVCFASQSPSIPFGFALLTSVGRQLAGFCEAAPSEQVFEKLLSELIAEDRSLFSKLSI